MKKLKEFMQTSLGTFGMILFFLVGVFLSIYPLLMFNLPPWLCTVLALLIQFVFIHIPLFLELLWIAGFFGAVFGPQDAIAIVYYVVFSIIVLALITKIFKLFLKKG